jgi:hypothetical protein
MDAANAILIGAVCATAGWVYTSRRARTLARKQHTVNIMLQASLNKEFRSARDDVAPHVRAKQVPDLNLQENKDLRISLRMILNHYEFMAAGVRNGDFDEVLLRDSERGTIMSLFEGCHDYIWGLRNNRSRLTIYEHLEWLHGRWETKRPRWQRACEFCIGRPLPGKRAVPTP